MKNKIKDSLNALKTTDVYSLILFILYKLKEIPEYAVLSELCYLLDGSSIIRLLTFFAGKTITIPTEAEFVEMTNALLLYQYVNIDGCTLTEAQAKLQNATAKQKDRATSLYLKIIPIINSYNFDRRQVQHG